VLCSSCRVPGSAYAAAETVQLLGALLAGDWAVADIAEERHRREARGLVSAYLSWHLERGLRSMPYVHESGAS
jgi:DNA repair protein RecO (recombination protein O)